MVDGKKFGRRTAIKGISGLLAGGVIPATSMAASTSGSSEQYDSDKKTTEFDFGLSVEDGRVVVAGDDSFQPAAKEFDLNDSNIELDSESVAGFLNHGIEQGHFNVYEEGGTVMVEPTVSFESSTSSPELAQPQQIPRPGGGGGCGVTSVNWSLGGYKRSVTIKMSHAATERAIIMLAAGATLSAVASGLLSWSGITTVATPVLMIIAAALGFAATVLDVVDDGCGVVITYTRIPYGGSYGDVYPQ